jgi:hypothetical protein
MVRASAGERLIKLIPERVVPVLRAIDQKDDGGAATIKANLVLFAREHEQKELGNRKNN